MGQEEVVFVHCRETQEQNNVAHRHSHTATNAAYVMVLIAFLLLFACLLFAGISTRINMWILLATGAALSIAFTIFAIVWTTAE